jgi:hypothetical protein
MRVVVVEVQRKQEPTPWPPTTTRSPLPTLQAEEAMGSVLTSTAHSQPMPVAEVQERISSKVPIRNAASEERAVVAMDNLSTMGLL